MRFAGVRSRQTVPRSPVHGMSELVECDVSEVRAAITERYLGMDDDARFAAAEEIQTRGVAPPCVRHRASGICRESCRSDLNRVD